MKKKPLKKKKKTVKVIVIETTYKIVDVPENFFKLTSSKMKK